MVPSISVIVLAASAPEVATTLTPVVLVPGIFLIVIGVRRLRDPNLVDRRTVTTAMIVTGVVLVVVGLVLIGVQHR